MGGSKVDQELVRRVQQGDSHAFNLLVLKYQYKIIKLVTRYLRNPTDAMDVAQEAFIKAYRAMPNFRGESAFYTWLYRIAINAAKNHIIQKDRAPPNTDIDVQDAENLDSGECLKETETPERLLLRDEIEQVVLSVIQTLPEELQQAISLREIEGLSYEEIATSMSCPVGTVRSRIFRAREAIDKQIKPLMREE